MPVVAIPVTNPGAEDDLTGWTFTGNILVGTALSTPSPYVGTKYWYVSDATAYLEQTCALPAETLVFVGATDGYLRVKFAYGNNSNPPGSGFTFQVRALDSSGNDLGVVYNSGTVIGPVEDQWYVVDTVSVPSLLPASTTQVRIEVTFGNEVESSNGYLDDIYLEVTDEEPANVIVAGMESHVMYGIGSDIILSGMEANIVLNQVPATVYSEGLRFNGLEMHYAVGMPSPMVVSGMESHVLLNQAPATTYTDGMRANGLEAHVAYGVDSPLVLSGMEAHYFYGLASDLAVNAMEAHILVSRQQKKTPIIAIMNDVQTDDYQQSYTQVVLYENPVRG